MEMDQERRMEKARQERSGAYAYGRGHQGLSQEKALQLCHAGLPTLTLLTGWSMPGQLSQT